MNCEIFELYGSAYIDNVLSDKEKLEFENHMNICTCCSVKLENLKMIVESMNEIEDVELPINFSSELRTKLEQEKATQTNNTRFNKKKMLSVIAAGIFIIITSVSLINNSPIYKDKNNLFGQVDRIPSNQEKVTFDLASEESIEAPSQSDKESHNQPMMMTLDSEQESQKSVVEDEIEEVGNENSNKIMTARSSENSLESEDLQIQPISTKDNKIIYLIALISIITCVVVLVYKKFKNRH